MSLDPFQRMVMANLSDLLADLKWFLQPRESGELVRGLEYGPKPLAEIRWFLTAPDGGELMCELAGLVVWAEYQKRALNLFARAEEINPHLTSELWEYLTQPLEDEDDGEDWVVPILPDLPDGGRRAYTGRLVNLAPPRTKNVSKKAHKSSRKGGGGKATNNLTVVPNKSDWVQGELFGEGELK